MKPQAPGWYWYKSDGLPYMPLFVDWVGDKNGTHLYVHFIEFPGYSETAMPIDEVKGVWLGRCPETEEMLTDHPGFGMR